MLKSVTIIGAGAVGRSIALALFYAGVKIDGIYSLHGISARKVAKKTNTQKFGIVSDITSLGTCTIFCITDTQITNVATSLAQQGVTLKKKVILHTSGALSSDELQPLKKKGASIGSFHPMQTFPKNKPTAIKGVWTAIEGDSRALQMCRELAKIFQVRTFTISKEAKVLYHTAGVFASNYFVTLLSVVEQLAAEVKIPKKIVWNIYRPIIEQTLLNVIKTSPADALTGPIARGDVKTVTKHLQSLSKKNLNHLVPLYAALGIETTRLARRKNKRN